VPRKNGYPAGARIDFRAFLPKFLKYVNNYRMVAAILKEQTKIDICVARSPGHG
jgi:hypothetical protein